MKTKVIDVDFTEKSREVKRIKTEIANKWHNFKYRAKNLGCDIIAHPQESLAIIAVLSAGYSLGRKVLRDVKPTSTDKIFKRQQYEQYDNQLNIWWPLKHKMSTAEKLEFEAKRKDGKSVAEALREMNLLKK